MLSYCNLNELLKIEILSKFSEDNSRVLLIRHKIKRRSFVAWMSDNWECYFDLIKTNLMMIFRLMLKSLSNRKFRGKNS